MSGGAKKAVGPLQRVQQAVVLVVLFATLYWTTRLVPDANGGMSLIASVGFLLLAGTLAAELLEPLGIPHLTAYILAGIAAGPYTLHLIDHRSVEQLGQVNVLAVALIALAGGAELKLETLRRGFRTLAITTGFQTFGLLVLMTAVFFFCRPLIPFAQNLPWPELVGVGLLWGVLAITRSPSATLGILAQTRARGPVMDFAMSFIMSSDVVVIVVLATVLTLTRPLIEPGALLSLSAFSKLGHELLGSISLGTTLGLVLAVYLRFVEKQLLPVLLVLGFGFTEVLRYLNFEPLLTFLVAGFVVQNLSRQGEKFMHALDGAGSVVYVLFFAGAGAHLNVPLLRQLWPVALILCGARAVFSWGLHRVATRFTDDPPALRTWGWASLVSQAGVALGIGAIIERTLHGYGTPFRALVVATVAINEMIGPILFKLALDRAHETQTRRDALAEADAAPTPSPSPPLGPAPS